MIALLSLIGGLFLSKVVGLYRTPDIDSYFQEGRKKRELKSVPLSYNERERGSVPLGFLLGAIRGGYNREKKEGNYEPKTVKESRPVIGSSICGIQDEAKLYHELRKRESEWNFLKRWRYGRQARKEAERDMRENAEQEVDNYGLTREKREEQARLRTARVVLENEIEELKVVESSSGIDLRRLKEQERDLYQIVDDLSFIGREIVTQKRTKTESPANIRASYEKACRRLFNERLVPESIKAYLSELNGLIKSYLNGEEINPDLLETLVKRGEIKKVEYKGFVYDKSVELRKVRDRKVGYETTNAQIDSEITEINGTIEELKKLEHKKRMKSEAYRVRTLQRQVEYWIRGSGEREEVMELERKRDETVKKLEGLGKDMFAVLKHVIYPKGPSAPEVEEAPEEKKGSPNPVQEQNPPN